MGAHPGVGCAGVGHAQYATRCLGHGGLYAQHVGKGARKQLLPASGRQLAGDGAGGRPVGNARCGKRDAGGRGAQDGLLPIEPCGCGARELAHAAYAEGMRARIVGGGNACIH
ncbi:hypothetical protein DAPPUDRAFT_278022, partial [Daphnia pulex]